MKTITVLTAILLSTACARVNLIQRPINRGGVNLPGLIEYSAAGRGVAYRAAQDECRNRGMGIYVVSDSQSHSKLVWVYDRYVTLIQRQLQFVCH